MLEEIKAKISAEAEQLTHELNVTLPKRIQEAVALGDLRENSEYKSALERQQFVQARLGQLARRMAEVSKIDATEVSRDRAGFGSKLKVENLTSNKVMEFRIVTGDYMDLSKGHISMASPLGRGFAGARKGDEVTVRLPAGERRFRVLELKTLPEQMDDGKKKQVRS